MTQSNVDNDSKSKLNPPPRQGPHSNLSNKFLLPAGSSGPVQGTMWQNANWSGAGARHSEQTQRVRGRGQLLTPQCDTMGKGIELSHHCVILMAISRTKKPCKGVSEPLTTIKVCPIQPFFARDAKSFA